MICIKGNVFYKVQTLGGISLNDVKYYVTSRSFQRKFYHLEVIMRFLLKSLNPSLFSNKQQKMKTFRYDCWLIEIVRNMVCVRYMVNSPYSFINIHRKQTFLLTYSLYQPAKQLGAIGFTELEGFPTVPTFVFNKYSRLFFQF